MIKKYKYEIIIFIVEAICMTLELIASRVLSPYFGNSNIVWTSVIGIILLSSSLGNYIGGIIADKKDEKRSLKIVFLLASIWILCIPILQQSILELFATIITDIKIGAIISTIVLFFLPNLLLGFIIPIILKIKLENIEIVGKTSGRIYAISTIGGIFGTFLSGFFLIPNFGSVQILFVLSIILVLLSLFMDFKLDKITILYLVIILLINTSMFCHYSNNNIEASEQVLNGKENVIASFDTQYGRVLIYNTYSKKEPIRVLNIDSGYESATFTDEKKINELVFEYTEYYNLMFKSKKNIDNVLLIGGAGYSYPKYYISHFENKNMDVVEIDGDITEIARKYFYLDKLIKDYNIEENHRLNLINEDGRTYLNNNTKKYDAILNDAFSGKSPAKTLTTLETIKKIKESLNEDGLYLSNVISSLDGEKSKFIKAEVNTLRKVFKNVYIIPCIKSRDKNESQNIMVISTDQDIDFSDTYNLEIDKDEIILTDNYCPIDNLN